MKTYNLHVLSLSQAFTPSQNKTQTKPNVVIKRLHSFKIPKRKKYKSVCDIKTITPSFIYMHNVSLFLI